MYLYLLITLIPAISLFSSQLQAAESRPYEFSKSVYGENSAALRLYPQTPAFNCSAKLNNVEKMICDNSRLAVLDRILTEMYSKLKTQLDKQQLISVKDSLYSFQKSRNACATNICISYEYRLLILGLTEHYAEQLKNSSTIDYAELADAIHNSIPVDNPVKNSRPIEGIVHLASGDEHVCIANTKKVKCWGNNLGSVINTNKTFDAIQKLATGSWHQACVLDRGKAKCWGVCDDGQCEINNVNISFTDISSGGTFNCGISNAKVYCWGQNKYQQTQVPPDLLPVTRIESSRLFSCALQTDGKLRCWGHQEYGQLNLPPTNGTIKKIALGLYHGCVLTEDSKITCWGAGLTNTHQHPNYGQAAPPIVDDTFIDIAAGKTRTCGLTSKQKIMCWGEASDNKMNMPANTDGVTQVAVGDHHNCALTSEGARCWGYRWDEDHKRKFGMEGSNSPISFESVDP